MRIRVLKLGGSLLTRSDWPNRLRNWIGSQPIALNLLVVGGGEIVEAVRQLDQQHQLDAAFCHWLCIDLLSATSRIAGQLLPEVPVIENSEGLHEVLAGTDVPRHNPVYLIHIAAFYSAQTRSLLLPENWNTTSDALAAWLARQVQADELVLFKSVEPPQASMTAIELAQRGIVDPAMAEVISDLFPLRIVNLASPT